MKKSEFELWINNSDTRKVLEILNEEIKIQENALINGAYAGEETVERVGGKYLYASAYLAGLNFVIKDVVNHLEDDDNEQEDNRD